MPWSRRYARITRTASIAIAIASASVSPSVTTSGSAGTLTVKPPSACGSSITAKPSALGMIGLRIPHQLIVSPSGHHPAEQSPALACPVGALVRRSPRPPHQILHRNRQRPRQLSQRHRAPWLLARLDLRQVAGAYLRLLCQFPLCQPALLAPDFHRALVVQDAPQFVTGQVIPPSHLLADRLLIRETFRDS